MPRKPDYPAAPVPRHRSHTQPPMPQAERADYLKLVILLAMVFLPWAAIAFAMRLLIAMR